MNVADTTCSGPVVGTATGAPPAAPPPPPPPPPPRPAGRLNTLDTFFFPFTTSASKSPPGGAAKSVINRSVALGGGMGPGARPRPPRPTAALPGRLDEHLGHVLLHVHDEREQITAGRDREIGDHEVSGAERSHATRRQVRLHDLRDRAATLLPLEQEGERAVAQE